MELVPGVPITEYCDPHELDVRQRLELFIAVCQGVQHAHQKGVIHRDLKPSNILVRVTDGQPVPTIIDFGIAKAIERRLADGAFTTELGVMIGTPAYMSPEQAEASGLDIDTRADIYSLGMVLYELVTGVLPFEGRGLLLASFIAQYVLGHADTPTPSHRVAGWRRTAATTAAQLRRTTPVGLRRALRGDLDWIVLKAIERDRGPPLRDRRTASRSTFSDTWTTSRSSPGRPPRLHHRQVRPPSPARRLRRGDAPWRRWWCSRPASRASGTAPSGKAPRRRRSAASSRTCSSRQTPGREARARRPSSRRSAPASTGSTTEGSAIRSSPPRSDAPSAPYISASAAPPTPTPCCARRWPSG